ncbi:MAG: hypothetical protein NTX05_06550 [Fusobacteria bacterium]|nr:hypothetical protein [Fusobacteriota bacterium]
MDTEVGFHMAEDEFDREFDLDYYMLKACERLNGWKLLKEKLNLKPFDFKIKDLFNEEEWENIKSCSSTAISELEDLLFEDLKEYYFDFIEIVELKKYRVL